MFRKQTVHDVAFTGGDGTAAAPPGLLRPRDAPRAADLRHPRLAARGVPDRARPRPARRVQRLLRLPARPGRAPGRALHQRLLHRRPRPPGAALVGPRPAAPRLLGPPGGPVLVHRGQRGARPGRPPAPAGIPGQVAEVHVGADGFTRLPVEPLDLELARRPVAGRGAPSCRTCRRRSSGSRTRTPSSPAPASAPPCPAGTRPARAGVASAPGRSTTQASGRSPQRLSGIPITAASCTDGCAISSFSRSTEEIHSPPDLITSLIRSVMVKKPRSSSVPTSPVRSQPSRNFSGAGSWW